MISYNLRIRYLTQIVLFHLSNLCNYHLLFQSYCYIFFFNYLTQRINPY